MREVMIWIPSIRERIDGDDQYRIGIPLDAVIGILHIGYMPSFLPQTFHCGNGWNIQMLLLMMQHTVDGIQYHGLMQDIMLIAQHIGDDLHMMMG